MGIEVLSDAQSEMLGCVHTARKALLGCCIERHEVLDIEGEIFIEPEKTVFRTLRIMAEDGDPIDSGSVFARLMADGKIYHSENRAGNVPPGFLFECVEAWGQSHGIIPSLLDLIREGVDMAEAPGRPMVDLTQPVSVLAEVVGEELRTRPIFLMGEAVVTVDEMTGEVRTMTPDRFCSWVERFVTPFRFDRKGEEVVRTMGKDLAGKIMVADVFRARLRRLAGVNVVRLPVRREAGDAPVELLEEGYDAQSETWTHASLDFDTEMELAEAVEWISFLLGSWPWSEPGGVGKARSSSVQFAAMLGVFCRQMFPAGTPRPLMCYIGNQPGTGKSTLVAMALAPVFGAASTSDLPTSKEELRKSLDSAAEAFLPFLWYDDIGGGIYSNALNRFITAQSHSGRHLGSSERFEVPNVTQVFATGNGIKLTPDLVRRSLVVDLFVAGDVRGRNFDQNISPTWLARDEVRAKTLAAMWAAVKGWMGAGMPSGEGVPLESFEDWSATVAAIVQDFGFCDPLERAELSMGGDEEGDEFRRLFTALADEMPEEDGSEEFRRTELVDKARELGVLEELVGVEGDGAMKADANKLFGRRLGKWKGREFPATDGRVFEFGSRHSNRGTVYCCRIWTRTA